jgi:N-acetylglucosaminyl-diphospho-decaprenol L-rhamnosyltransferase
VPERVAVVIATHKHQDPLDRCVGSLLPMFASPGDLIFVDNGSTERVDNWVANRFPGLTVVRLKRNQLYCGGYNAGLQVAMDLKYSFVLILNADTEVVNPHFLDQLLEVAQRWPRAAFIGPQVFFRSRQVVQQTCLHYPRVWRHAVTWLPWRVAPLFFERQPQEETAVEFLNGVCMLCRVEALREIGLMDENMGGYMEDADWAWRARENGWFSLFVPIPSIVHHENRNGYEPYSLKTFLLKRNTVYWYLKNNMRYSGISHAKASIFLEKVRLLSARTIEERKMHEYFSRKLIRSYKGLLRNEPLGGWFGPPLGPWEGA